MKQLRDWSIGAKILFLIVTITGGAFTLAGIILGVLESHHNRRLLVEEIQVLAQLVANRSAAAVTFADREVAGENLHALSAHHAIDSACLYTPDGTMFARFERRGGCQPLFNGTAFRFDGNVLLVRQSVTQADEHLGDLILRANLSDLEERIVHYIQVLSLVLVTVVALAVVSAMRFHGLVTTPIRRLVETSKRVTDTRDYGIRADAGGAGGETGTLVSTFNAMLDVISAGDRALQYRIEFERVVERVSRRFIEADAETLDDVIGWSLEQAGALVCAGRSYLFRVAPDGRHFSNTHEWCAPGVRSGKDQLQSLSIEDYAFVFDSLTNERLFMVDDVEGLPDSLGTFQGLLKGQSVGSLINVPLNWGGKLQGFIGMDAIGQTGRWQRDDIDLLNIIAEVMAATLQRLQAQEALNQLNEELEKRVRSRTEELVLANQEMESFTYSVSHDLRSPLLVLDGFSQALLEDYGERLDDQGRTYLAYLREGSQELGDMIDALLSLSRSTRGELHCQSIDLSALATNCVADLRKSDPDRQVRVTIAEDLWGYGDLRLVRQVMVNLLDNAWKYTAPTPDARIEVGQETLAGRDMFFVSDNGVGFDIEHAERLFQPFQRMHREDEFPGTGIGLATVKRILLRHGGRVWTESAVGEGTTFYFNLGETKEQA